MRLGKLRSGEHLTGALLLITGCLLASGLVTHAAAECPVPCGGAEKDARLILAHAGHEWEDFQNSGDMFGGGPGTTKPKGWPFEGLEEKASYVPKSNRTVLPGTLGTYVGKKDLSPVMIVFALGSALFLGCAHALSPGHGKTMVAAYLVGSRGSPRDAVVLGGIVTFTHVVSVVILGIFCLYFSKQVVSQKVFPWIGAASGAVIFMVGYWMLARRAVGLEHGHSHHHPHHERVKNLPHLVSTGGPAEAPVEGHTSAGCQIGHLHHPHHGPGHDHEHHGHPHGHEHEHTHPHHEPGRDHVHPGHPHGHSHTPGPGPITMSSLVSLGLAGGMVPCPTALVILLSAISLGRVGFGLLLIVFFSVGLAAVLIVIGLLTVTASRFGERFSERRRWLQVLPVLSAGAVMIIGIGIAFNSLVAGGVLTVNR